MRSQEPFTVVLYAADGSIIAAEALPAPDVADARRAMMRLLKERPGAAGAELWQGRHRLAAQGTELLHIPRDCAN